MSKTLKTSISDTLKEHVLEVDWAMQDYEGCSCGMTFSWPDYHEKHLEHLMQVLYESI